MTSTRRAAGLTAALALAALALAACGKTTGPAAARTFTPGAIAAANPTISADVSAAARQGTADVEACVKAKDTGTETGMLTCLKGKLPAPVWKQAGACLGRDYMDDAGYTHAGYQTWKDHGIQPCVTAAEQAAAQAGK